MVKFISGSKEGWGKTKLVGFGLTKNDVEAIQKGTPLIFSMNEILMSPEQTIQMGDDVIVFYDEDEDTIIRKLKERPWDMSNMVFRDFRKGQVNEK